MPDATPAPAPSPSPAPPPAPSPAWYEGKAAPEIIGHWQNKGVDLTDPITVAVKMTEYHREAERFIGAPASEMLRIPKPTAAPADVKAFWERLGVPKEAKDYDLSGVKFAGADLEVGFADTLRQTFAENFVPKDRAAPIASAVVKWLEGQETADTAAAAARKAEQTANLDKLWGPKKTENMLRADEGARRLGVGSDEVKAIGDVIGLDRAAELFRKIGAGTADDTFVEGARGGAAPATAEAAAARLAELQSDKAWAKRLLSGDVAAKQEFDNLIRQSIAWVPEAA